MKNVVGSSFRLNTFFYTFTRLGRKARSAPVIKVRQTCSIILIHGRSRGSFSTSYLSRVPRNSFAVRRNGRMIYHCIILLLLLNKRIIMKESVFLLTPITPSPQTIEAFCFVQNLRFLPQSRTIRILIFPPVNRVDNARRESTRVAPSVWLTSENVKSVTIHHPLLQIFHAIQSAGWLNGFPLLSRLTTTKGTFVRGWRGKEKERRSD